jgi:uncharacterized protein
MLLADVDVFVHAHRYDSLTGDEHASWLADRLAGPEPFGVSELVLSGFLRVVTNHRVYHDPTAPLIALEFCQDVLSAPASVAVRPGPRHWGIFSSLCREVRARGTTVPDAYLAALAIEHGATWVTNDRGFARFPGLRWTTPLAD